MKFKVGDKVVVKSKAEIAKAYGGDSNDMPGSWDDDMDEYCGKTGEIVSINDEGHCVKFTDGNHWYYGEKALESPQSTVTITFNGDTTIATDGEKTVSVTKYHGDEYSEETGAIEAIKKLYHRFPQKGDTYYSVGVDVIAEIDSFPYTADKFDDDLRKSGNFYETKEAAQKAADKINAIFKEVH